MSFFGGMYPEQNGYKQQLLSSLVALFIMIREKASHIQREINDLVTCTMELACLVLRKPTHCTIRSESRLVHYMNLVQKWVDDN